MLVRVIQGDTLATQHVLLKPELIVRESSGVLHRG
jgi:DNA-binding LacI/PurR family transcriptional regulator